MACYQRRKFLNLVIIMSTRKVYKRCKYCVLTHLSQRHVRINSLFMSYV